MIKLRNLTEADFNVVASWCTNEAELFQFAGFLFTFPISLQQYTSYIADPRRTALAVDFNNSGLLIGCCELNFENLLPRLSRILIGDKKYRHKGLGQQLLNEMLKILFVEKGFVQADLNVFDWNESAIGCYLR